MPVLSRFIRVSHRVSLLPHEVACVGFVARLQCQAFLLPCLEYTMLKYSFLAGFFYICIFLHKTQRKKSTQVLRGTLEFCFLYLFSSSFC